MNPLITKKRVQQNQTCEQLTLNNFMQVTDKSSDLFEASRGILNSKNLHHAVTNRRGSWAFSMRHFL